MTLNFSKLFEQTDDFDGGKLQTVKRRFKLWLRVKKHTDQLNQLDQYLSARGLDPLKELMPHLQLKCLRSYLWEGLNGQQRLEAQLAHLDWMQNSWNREELISLHEKRAFVLFQWTIGEHGFKLEFGPSRSMDREGDLEAHLLMDEQPLLRTSFSILPLNVFGPHEKGHALYVGGLQGGQDAKELTKRATQLFERVKPPHILLNIFQGLAQGWGLQMLVGVAHNHHVYSSYRRLASRVSMNYDSLWKELGGNEMALPIGWQLPLTWSERSLEEVESKKRSQLKRRNQMRSQIYYMAKEAGENWTAIFRSKL